MKQFIDCDLNSGVNVFNDDVLDALSELTDWKIFSANAKWIYNCFGFGGMALNKLEFWCGSRNGDVM